MKYSMIWIALCLMAVGCGDSPKVIEASGTPSGASGGSETGIFSGGKASDSSVPVSGDIKTIEALEVLPTEKYVYVRTEENGEEVWIATGKMEVAVGQKYFYKNGLLKTNFESKEYKRTFDKVYLVGNLVPVNHGGSSVASSASSNETKEAPVKMVRAEGSMSIKELVTNKKKYAGKEIQLSGICTKINPNIMGRNWVHLKDGSMDDYDLVATTDIMIPEGHPVTLVGTVKLDQDFGAGYTYDLIIENARAVQQ